MRAGSTPSDINGLSINHGLGDSIDDSLGLDHGCLLGDFVLHFCALATCVLLDGFVVLSSLQSDLERCALSVRGLVVWLRLLSVNDLRQLLVSHSNQRLRRVV